MKIIYLTRHRLLPIRELLPASGEPGWTEPPGRSWHEECKVSAVDWQGWDCLDEAEAPTIARVGRVAESVGSCGGRRVGGPRRRGDSSRPESQGSSLATCLYAFAVRVRAR